MTRRQPVPPALGSLGDHAAQFDDLFLSVARCRLRHEGERLSRWRFVAM
jgi:hypothetical protein